MIAWDISHVAAVLAPIVCGLAALWRRATADMRRSADWRARVDERLSDMDGRLADIESRRGPTREDMGRIHRRMDEVDGRLSRLEGGTDEARRTLALIHEYLMRRDD